MRIAAVAVPGVRPADRNGRPRLCRSAAAQRAITQKQGGTEVWQVIYLGKSRIGHSRSYTRPVTVEGKSFLKCEYETHLAIKRFGQALQFDTRRETIESPDGSLQSFVYEMKNPPAAPTRTIWPRRREPPGR